MTGRALSVRAQLEAYEERSFGRSWTVEELLIGLVGDLGDLAKAIQAREGVRALDDVDRRLEHELSDWCGRRSSLQIGAESTSRPHSRGR